MYTTDVAAVNVSENVEMAVCDSTWSVGNTGMAVVPVDDDDDEDDDEPPVDDDDEEEEFDAGGTGTAVEESATPVEEEEEEEELVGAGPVWPADEDDGVSLAVDDDTGERPPPVEEDELEAAADPVDEDKMGAGSAVEEEEYTAVQVLPVYGHGQLHMTPVLSWTHVPPF